MVSKYITNNITITLSNDIFSWTNINNIHRHHNIILILIIKICKYVVGRDSIHYKDNLNQINKNELLIYHNIINKDHMIIDDKYINLYIYINQKLIELFILIRCFCLSVF